VSNKFTKLHKLLYEMCPKSVHKMHLLLRHFRLDETVVMERRLRIGVNIIPAILIMAKYWSCFYFVFICVNLCLLRILHYFSADYADSRRLNTSRLSNSHYGINFVAQDSILAYPSPFYKTNIECWATFIARQVS